MEDELDELKKIFFEFLKRWTDTGRNDFNPNRPVLYEHSRDVEEFKLNAVPDSQTILRDLDEFESKDLDAFSLGSRPFERGT